MAFWGVEVKPGKSFTLKHTEATCIRRLHLSQATLGFGNGTNKTTLQCNDRNKSPLFLCVLTPEKVDSCQLNLEFEEADEVIFSVIGPRSLHLTGYFLGRSTSLKLNDDESESYGEDIVDTDVDKASSDDYDYSDSFINDDDPSGCGSDVSSTDDDEISIKKMAAKTKDKKRNGRGGRLRKTYQISDSDSDETSARTDDSSTRNAIEVENIKNDLKNPIVISSEVKSSRVTRSKAKSYTLENSDPNAKFEKASEARTHTHKGLGKKREDKPLDDIELSPVQKDSEIPSKKKRNKEKSKGSVVVDPEAKDMHESLQNEKPATAKEIKSSSDVSPSQENGESTLSKKKRKRDKGAEVTYVKKDTKKPAQQKTSSNEVIIEEIRKGKLDGKTAVKGKKVSILYSGKVKDTGKLFDSNLGEAPLRFRLGGEKVIEGLSVGVEGMRVGDKRRLIIPPSLGYLKGGMKKDVPKNAWLVYEVEAVKVR